MAEIVVAENSEVDDEGLQATSEIPHQHKHLADTPHNIHCIPKSELELLSTIGEGGFCDVWEGRWFGATVAIKRLKLTGDKKIDGTKASDFLKEIKLHAKLSFPQIIPIMGMCIEDPKEMFLVMEQASLGSLFGLLHVHDHRTQPIDMPMALRVCLVADCASAIAYVHSRGIVHRDIKSMNYLVFPGWRLKLCDFGLSVPVSECETAFAKQNGTFAWLAPECIFDRRYSKASDVYALAMMGYEILKRKPPFDGMSDAAITKAMKADTRPSLKKESKTEDDIPAELSDLLQDGWSKDISKRPSSVEFESQFRKCVDERYGGDPRNDQLLALLNIDFLDSSKLFETTNTSQQDVSYQSSPLHGTRLKNGPVGSLTSPSHFKWDHGLDVGQLRLAFLEMAESGVIFERAKELSLHLSRTQNKPFVHDSETNQSVFLDEDGVSTEIVMEANSIMHKLIRHYARKQRRAFVVSESLGVSSGMQSSRGGGGNSSPRERSLKQASAQGSSFHHQGYHNSDEVSQSSSDEAQTSPVSNNDDGSASLSTMTLSRLAAEAPKDTRRPHHSRERYLQNGESSGSHRSLGKTSQASSQKGRGGGAAPRKTSGPRMV